MPLLKSRFLVTTSFLALAATAVPAAAQDVTNATPQDSVVINYNIDGSYINNSIIGEDSGGVIAPVGLTVEPTVTITGDIDNNEFIYASQTGIRIDDATIGGVVRNDGVIAITNSGTSSSDPIIGIGSDIGSGTDDFELQIVNTGTISVDVSTGFTSDSIGFGPSVAGAGILQDADGPSSRTQTVTNSGSIGVTISADVSATSEAGVFAIGYGVFQEASVNDAGASADATVDNTGKIVVDVQASAQSTGGFDSAAVAAARAFGIQQTVSGEAANARVTNTNSILATASATAEAFGFGTISETSAFDGANAPAFAVGIAQGVQGSSSLASVINQGTITTIADSSLQGYAGGAPILGSPGPGGPGGLGGLLGLGQNGAVAAGIYQYGSGTDATMRVVNEGTIAAIARSEAEIVDSVGGFGGYGYGTGAVAVGVYQQADAGFEAGVARAVVQNSGSISANAESGSDQFGLFGEALPAVAQAVGVYQGLSGPDAFADVVNAGTIAASANATATGAYGYASANAIGVLQGAGALLPTTAGATLTNTRDISAIADIALLGEITSDGSATAAGVSQTATSTGNTTASVRNQGTILAQATIAAGAADSAIVPQNADVYGYATGVSQSVAAYGGGGDTEAYTALAEVRNTGRIVGTAVATAGAVDAAASAEAFGISQSVESNGELQNAIASVDNRGVITATAEAVARGSFADPSLGASSSADASASATAIEQYANGPNSAALVVNQGTISASAVADALIAEGASSSASASANASGIQQETDGLASVSNSGVIVATATARARGDGIYDNSASASADAVEQEFYGENGVSRLRNSGSIRATATVEGNTDVYGYATGFQVSNEEGGSLALDVVNDGLISAIARGTVASATGYGTVGAYGMSIDGDDATGRVVNSGNIIASAIATGGDLYAEAYGIDVETDAGDLTVVNRGLISAYAEGADAEAVGIYFEGDSDGPSDLTASVINQGGTIWAGVSTDGGATTQRGTAIDVSNSDQDMLVGLRRGDIFGNILTGTEGRIVVTEGETRFDGVINPESTVGSLTIADQGELTLLFDDNGPSEGYVDSFVVGATGTIGFGLRADPSTYSRIVANTADLDGTLKARFGVGLYGDDLFYDNVIDATVREGAFDSVISSTPLLAVAALYDDEENVDLAVERVAFGDVPGLTRNQRSLGGYIEQFYSPTLAGPYGDLVAGLFGLDEEGYRATLDSLSGAIYPQQLQHALWSFQNLNTILTTRFGAAGTSSGPLAYGPTGSGSPASMAIATNGDAAAQIERGVEMWARAYGSAVDVDGDGNGPGYDAGQGGFYVGGDFKPTAETTFGLVAGYISTGLDFDNGADIDSDGFQLAAYGAYDFGTGYMRGVAGYGAYSNDSTRPVPGLGIARGSYDTDVVSLYGEAGYRALVGPAYTVTPFAALGFASASNDGFTETGLSIANLTVDGADGQSLMSTLGVQLDGDYVAGNGQVFNGKLRLGWQHEFLDDYQSIGASFVGAPGGTGFVTTGSDVPSDLAVLGATVGVALSASSSLSVDYQGRYGSDFAESSLGLKFEQRF